MRPKITQIGTLWIWCSAPLCSGMAFCRTGKGSQGQPRIAKETPLAGVLQDALSRSSTWLEKEGLWLASDV